AFAIEDHIAGLAAHVDAVRVVAQGHDHAAVEFGADKPVFSRRFDAVRLVAFRPDRAFQRASRLSRAKADDLDGGGIVAFGDRAAGDAADGEAALGLGIGGVGAGAAGDHVAGDVDAHHAFAVGIGRVRIGTQCLDLAGDPDVRGPLTGDGLGRDGAG